MINAITIPLEEVCYTKNSVQTAFHSGKCPKTNTGSMRKMPYKKYPPKTQTNQHTLLNIINIIWFNPDVSITYTQNVCLRGSASWASSTVRVFVRWRHAWQRWVTSGRWSSTSLSHNGLCCRRDKEQGRRVCVRMSQAINQLLIKAKLPLVSLLAHLVPMSSQLP